MCSVAVCCCSRTSLANSSPRSTQSWRVFTPSCVLHGILAPLTRDARRVRSFSYLLTVSMDEGSSWRQNESSIARLFQGSFRIFTDPERVRGSQRVILGERMVWFDEGAREKRRWSDVHGPITFVREARIERHSLRHVLIPDE